MKKIFSFTLILAMLIGLWSFAPVQAEFSVSPMDDELESKAVLTFPIDQLITESVMIEGESYTRVILPEMQNDVISGSPALPVETLFFAVPIGADIALEVIPGAFDRIALESPVIPAPSFADPDFDFQKDPYEQIPVNKQAFYQLDPEIYQNTSPYPEALARLTSDGMFRNQRIVSVSVYPIQYDPGMQQLLAFHEIKVRLSFTGFDLRSDFEIGFDHEDIEDIYRNMLVNYEQGLHWRAIDSSQALAQSGFVEDTNPEWAPSKNSWRIEVSETGMQRISYEMLSSAGGLPSNADPRNFQIFNNGEAIPCLVSGEADGNFDVNDSIDFYGVKLLNKYSNKNIYWLTLQDTPGTRMTSKSVVPGSATLDTTTQLTRRFEQNLSYKSMLPGDDLLDRFIWRDLYAYPGYPSTWSTTLNLPNVTADAAASVLIKFFGMSSNSTVNPDHIVEVSINGSNLGTVRWDGQFPYLANLAIPAIVLNPGTNTITFSMNAGHGVNDFVNLDWFEINYIANNTAVSDQALLRNSSSGYWQYQVPGFTGSTLTGFDVSQPNNPIQLTGISVTEDSGLYQATFQDFCPIEVEYRLQTETQYHQPAVFRDNYSTLRSATNGADYIVISHANFIGAAQTLADYRQSKGLRTAVVDVQDIYDEFSYGQIRPIAIRDFLRFTYQNWAQPAPSYVVLVGDANYDPNHYLSTSGPSWVPSYLGSIDPIMNEVATDNHFVNIVGIDKMPDMMLGRLPVSTLTEAQQVVSKIINYETQPLEGDWHKNWLFISDNADSAGNFPVLSDAMLASYKPNNYSVQKAYLGIDGDAAALRPIITAALNGGDSNNVGVSLVNFFGHGNELQWAHENLLNASTVRTLTNASKLPFVVAMDCLDSNFLHPTNNLTSIGETFLLHPSGGGIAVYGATGQSVATGHESLDRGLLRALFLSGSKALGQAVISSKLNLWAMGNYLELMDTYVFLGDPATVLVRELYAVNDLYSTDVDQTLTVPVSKGVIINDLNPQNLPDISATMVGALSPSNAGKLTFKSDGSLTFIPAQSYEGTATFTYQLESSMGVVSNRATVFLAVYPPNNIPTDIILYSDPLYENYPIGTRAGRFMTVDEDPNDYYTYELVPGTGSEDNDSFTVDGDQLLSAEVFDFEEKNQYNIRVRSTDHKGGRVEKEFIIDILDLNDFPFPQDDYLFGVPNVPTVIPFVVLLANDHDDDGDELTIVDVYFPVNGTVEIVGENVIFTPDPDFLGLATFYYVVSDGMFTNNGKVTVDYRYRLFLPLVSLE